MERVIGEIKKGKGKVVVRIYDFKNVNYIDIRNFFENDKKEEVPTKKGIAIPLNNLSELITILEKAEQQTQKA